jgi:hypothetical protein
MAVEDLDNLRACLANMRPGYEEDRKWQANRPAGSPVDYSLGLADGRLACCDAIIEIVDQMIAVKRAEATPVEPKHDYTLEALTTVLAELQGIQRTTNALVDALAQGDGTIGSLPLENARGMNFGVDACVSIVQAGVDSWAGRGDDGES